ncbi:MAG: MoaD/ThiS family protein [Candidatus Kariarchaeaceae archaeon]|jgi:sulfur carrier protein ThiS
MKASVHVQGVFRNKHIKKDIDLEITSPTTLEQLLCELTDYIKIDIMDAISKGEIRPNIMINGNMVPEDDYSVLIKNNDEILVFQAIGGG